ncbi:MAG: AEC family transporter [Pseudomonadota bacterium]
MADSALVSIVLPVFGLIGLGYLAAALKILPESVGDGLAGFVFTLAIPLLLFRAIGTLEIPDLNPWPFWIAYFGGVAVNIPLGYFIARRLFGRDARASVVAGIATSYSNVVMVAMPLIDKAFGEVGLVTVLLLIAVHLPVMTFVSAVLIEVADAKGDEGSGASRFAASLWRVLRGLATNPFIVGIAAGVAFRLTGLPLTGVPAIVIERVSDTAIPLALVALGMSLKRYGISGNIGPAILIGAVKLSVMPVVVFVLAAYVFALPPLAIAVAVISAAGPTGANAYIMATRFNTGLALSANTITLTTAVSVLTLGLWLSLFVTVGPALN